MILFKNSSSQTQRHKEYLLCLPAEQILSTNKTLHASSLVINEHKTQGRTLRHSTASSHEMYAFAVVSSHLILLLLISSVEYIAELHLKTNRKRNLMVLTVHEKTAKRVKPRLAHGARLLKKTEMS